jgi:hypothetical protein
VHAEEASEPFVVFTERKEYFVGELINVYVKVAALDANQTVTVTDVVVFDPNNMSVAEWRGISIVLTSAGETQYIGTVAATSEGNYTVSADATATVSAGGGYGTTAGASGRHVCWIRRVIWRFFCRGFRHVVPEVPLGTIAASAAMIVGLAGYVFMPRWRRKRE